MHATTSTASKTTHVMSTKPADSACPAWTPNGSPAVRLTAHAAIAAPLSAAPNQSSGATGASAPPPRTRVAASRSPRSRCLRRPTRPSATAPSPGGSRPHRPRSRRGIFACRPRGRTTARLLTISRTSAAEGVTSPRSSTSVMKFPLAKHVPVKRAGRPQLYARRRKCRRRRPSTRLCRVGAVGAVLVGTRVTTFGLGAPLTARPPAGCATIARSRPSIPRRAPARLAPLPHRSLVGTRHAFSWPASATS